MLKLFTVEGQVDACLKLLSGLVDRLNTLWGRAAGEIASCQDKVEVHQAFIQAEERKIDRLKTQQFRINRLKDRVLNSGE